MVWQNIIKLKHFSEFIAAPLISQTWHERTIKLVRIPVGRFLVLVEQETLQGCVDNTQNNHLKKYTTKGFYVLSKHGCFFTLIFAVSLRLSLFLRERQEKKDFNFPFQAFISMCCSVTLLFLFPWSILQQSAWRD